MDSLKFSGHETFACRHYWLKKGYDFDVIFDYANGVSENAPVRLAGVNTGEVKKIEIFFDEKEERTRVKTKLWINGEIKISNIF